MIQPVGPLRLACVADLVSWTPDDAEDKTVAVMTSPGVDKPSHTTVSSDGAAFVARITESVERVGS
jgi:hypothetical protein